MSVSFVNHAYGQILDFLLSLALPYCASQIAFSPSSSLFVRNTLPAQHWGRGLLLPFCPVRLAVTIIWLFITSVYPQKFFLLSSSSLPQAIHLQFCCCLPLQLSPVTQQRIWLLFPVYFLPVSCRMLCHNTMTDTKP